MPGGKIGGGGHSSGGGRIGGGGGRIGGSSFRPSSSSGHRPSGGFTGGYSGGFGGGSFWQGMLFGSMMSNQNRPHSQGYGYSNTPPHTQTGPYHQQPTFQQTPQQQQYQQAQQTYHGQSKSTGAGCLTALLILLIFFAVFALMAGGGSGGIPKSTVERTRLDSKYVTKTAYFKDTAGVVGSTSTLEKGLKAFYDKTGVQPYVYFTTDIDGDINPDNDVLDAYCEKLYGELFSDEGHMLVVSYGYDNLGYWYWIGHNAETVMDAEAREIFETYVDHYANDLVYDNIGLDEFYANVFSDTGERIMQVTPNYRMMLIIGIVVLVILFLLFRWWQKVKEQKNKEAAHAEAVLNADINDMVNDPTLSNLEEKYENYPSPKPGTAAKPSGSPSAGMEGQYQSYPNNAAAKPDYERPKDERPSGKAETYESAREQELKDPALQELEDKYN